MNYDDERKKIHDRHNSTSWLELTALIGWLVFVVFIIFKAYQMARGES